MRIGSVIAACLAGGLVFSLLGCGTKIGGPVVGSCDEPKKPDDFSSTHVCSDYHDKRLLKDTCTQKGAHVQTTPCDRTGAIGACMGKYGERWMYNDQLLYPDAQALSKLCGSDPVMLPNGTVFKPKSDSAVNADKAKENMAKYGAKAKATVATIASIGAKKLPAPTGKVNLEGLKGSAILVHAEDLTDPEHPKTIPYRLSYSDRLASCSRLVNNRPTPKDDGSALYDCSQYPVLVVVSVSSLKKAASTGTTVSGNTKTTLYSKGQMSGDVFVFRTDNGKYLGSFGWIAENGEMPVFPNQEKLDTDLYEHFASTITGLSQKHMPGLFSSVSLAK